VSNPFAEATTVEERAPWSLRPLPRGGLVTAVALRAMHEHLDEPEPRLVAHATQLFLFTFPD